MNTLSNTINVDNDTYRYTSENKRRPWDISKSYSKENYFGDKRISYNTCLMPIGSYDFDGKSIKLELNAYVYKPSNEFPQFCWAICTSDKNKQMYENIHGEVKDDTQIAWGTAKLNKLYYNWQTFDFPCESIPANTPLYIYFWPYSTGGVAHIDKDITATLHYEPRQLIKASKKVEYNENIETKRSL